MSRPFTRILHDNNTKKLLTNDRYKLKTRKSQRNFRNPKSEKKLTKFFWRPEDFHKNYMISNYEIDSVIRNYAFHVQT